MTHPHTVAELETAIDALLAHEPPTLHDVVECVRLARCARDIGHRNGAYFLDELARGLVSSVKGLSYVAVAGNRARND